MKVHTQEEAVKIKAEGNGRRKKGNRQQFIAKISELAKIHKGKAVTLTAGEDFKEFYSGGFYPVGGMLTELSKAGISVIKTALVKDNKGVEDINKFSSLTFQF